MLVFASVVFLALLPQTDVLALSGIVLDPSSKPIAGINVKLEEPTAQRTWAVQTNSEGAFRFDRLAFGTYRVTVNGEGYFEISAEIRMESSKTVEFILAAAETLKQEVDVIARPEPINLDSVAPQNVVNDEVIQNLPFTGRQNFLNALSLMPGVLRDNTNQIHIHGSRPDQIRYQLDGLQVTDASTGGLGANIPIDAIESVDMDLANYSAEFGKASGGIVRVHSQFIGDKYRFNFTDFIPGWDFRQKSIAEFSPRLSFSGPLVRNKLWFMYSNTVRYIHSFLEELRTPENERSRTQSTADQLLKVQWNLKESHVLTLQVLHNAEYFGNSGLSLVRPLEATTNALKRGTTIGLSERRTAGRKLLETTLQWTNNHESDLAKGNRLLEIHPHLWSGHYHTDQRGRVRRFHAAETITWDRRGDRLDHRIKAGGEFDWVDSNVHLERRPFALFNEYDDLKSLVSFDGATVSGIRNQEYGAFVQDRLTLGPRLQVELGLRYDRERVTGLNNLGPRASFSFLPFGTSESKVSGGIGRFYDNIALLSLQMPRLQRRYTTVYSGGNPVTTPMATDVRVDSALRNPNGLHWNLAWENEWAPRWVTRIAYFEKTGRDQVRLAAVTNVSGFDMVFNNSGQSHYRALEISLDRAIRTDIRFLASYIYSKATARPSLWLDFPDPSVEYLGEAPVEWNIPHRFVGWGYFPLPSGFSASFSVEARSGFPFTVIDDMHQLAEGYNRRQLPVYFATNASVEKQIPIPLGKGKRVAFRVGVTNLFNRFNPRYVDQNINSPYFLSLADSSQRHFSARIRILKK